MDDRNDGLRTCGPVEDIPAVSVVVTTHNCEGFIESTINSVRQQEGCSYEIIIIDDASTDSTEDVVRAMNLPGVQVYRLSKNHGGPSKPRNIGVGMALGKYIAFLDGDDLMLPGRLKLSVDFLEHRHDAALVFSDALKVHVTSEREPKRLLRDYDFFWSVPKINLGEGRLLINAADVFKAIFYEQFIFPSGVTARKEVLIAQGLFDESLTNAEDMDLWFRITRYHPVGFIPKPLFLYQIRNGSIESSASYRGARFFENRIKVVQKQLNAGVPKDVAVPAEKLLSEYYSHLGFFYRTRFDMKKARHFFGKAICGHFTIKYLRGYFLSLCRISPRPARKTT